MTRSDPPIGYRGAFFINYSSTLGGGKKLSDEVSGKGVGEFAGELSCVRDNSGFSSVSVSIISSSVADNGLKRISSYASKAGSMLCSAGSSSSAVVFHKIRLAE